MTCTDLTIISGIFRSLNVALNEEIVKDTVSEYCESTLAGVVSKVVIQWNSFYEELLNIRQSSEYCEFPSQNLVTMIE